MPAPIAPGWRGRAWLEALGFPTRSSRPCSQPLGESANPGDSVRVAMLGLPGLRIFEATAADIAGRCEEHGQRVLRVRGRGSLIVLVTLPSAAGRAIGPRTRRRWPGERRRRHCRDCCECCLLTLTPAANAG